MDKELQLQGFVPLGILVNNAFEKTAAERASQSLVLDAYVAGLETGLGIEEGIENMAKVASCEMGRELAMDIFGQMLLEK